uniref:Uncharacterized protein n=1 Tax=Timema cristinae TaxID=61476 RepID=A0A7R9DMU4_TIMCR|nr:unnamed protein product [Timema cristinae]
MLTSVPIPSISSINFHPLKFYTAESSEQHPRFHLPQAPVYMHLDHLHTNFVYMFVLLNTSGLSTALRPYLPLFLESLLELPILRGDTLVPYEQVVAQLETDTISVSASIGLENSSRFHCGAFSHTAVLMLQLEPAKYSRCVTWIRELLYQTQFTVERLRILASKIANDVAQVKRKGNKVVSDLMKDSNHYSSSMLRQHKFLTSLLERLESPAMSQKVLQELEEVRAVLTQPANIVVHLAADMDKLPGDPAEPWAQMLPSGVNPKRIKLAVTPDWALLTPPCEQKNGSCVVRLAPRWVP